MYLCLKVLLQPRRLRHFLQRLCQKEKALIIRPVVLVTQQLFFQVVINQLAEYLHQKPPLFAFRRAGAGLLNKGVHDFPALPEFGRNLVYLLFLAAQRRTGHAFNADAPQVFKKFVKRQTPLGKNTVDFRLYFRRKAAKRRFAAHIIPPDRSVPRPRRFHPPQQRQAREG